MRLIQRHQVPELRLPGRIIQKAVGKEDALSFSREMSMGFAHYSAESGPMQPHRHAEEIIYVLGVQDGWVRYGGEAEQPDHLTHTIPLEVGMVLHIPANEWHVFEYGPGGFVDVLFFYGRQDLFSSHSTTGA
jgi:hypothetical protein